MVKTQRLAAIVVTTVLAGRNLNEVLAATWAREKSLSGGERGAIQDLSFGVLRHLGQLQAQVRRFLKRPLAEPLLANLLLVAMYQLLYSREPAYAVLNSAADAARGLSRRTWAVPVVNGVLRNFLRNADLTGASGDSEAARFSYPEWWIDRVRSAFPAQWEAILVAGNLHPPLTLRLNRRRTDVAAYESLAQAAGFAAQRLGAYGIRLTPARPVDAIPGFAAGLVSVQDLAAQHAAELLELRDGLRVLDACAAPGGKTGLLLEMAAVDLLAIDRDAARLARVEDNLTRLGLRAQLLAADAAATDRWWDGRPFARILLDAPCTGSGVVKRHPDIKWLRRPGDLQTFTAQQSRLLDALWHVLGKGGKLLYVTCSIFPEENQEQITAFCQRHSDAAYSPLDRAPFQGGLIVPNELQDGFFYALLEKR